MTKRVYIAVPDGADGEGGIARQMGYFWRHHQGSARRADYDLKPLVTRGNYGRGWAILFFLVACLQLFIACFRKRIDFLHVNLASRGSTSRKLILCWIVSKFGVPFVVHLHGGGYADFYADAKPLLRRAIEWMFAQAREVIVLGAGGRDFVVETMKVEAARVAIVPNGVPVPQMPESERADLEICHIVFLGHVLLSKGLAELLEALAREEMRDLPWRLTIAGNGADLAKLQEKTIALALVEKVDFAGWLNQRQIGRLYADADLLVLPSHVENLPLVILEAMAARVAVLATTVGAIPEVLQDGRTALLVPPKDVDALAAALRRMVVEPELRRELAEQAGYRYEMLYGIEAYHEMVLAVYGG